MSFEQSLTKGKVGESRIADYYKRKGFAVLPVYEVEMQSGKGPRVFTFDSEIIAPDMIVFKGEQCYWVEAKHKTAFSWHRKTQRFVTGIDLHHYHDYCKIDDETPWPVWLMFLHTGGQAKDSPPSPSGLYGNPLRYLREHENNRHENWGKGGMVYWCIDELELLADY